MRACSHNHITADQLVTSNLISQEEEEQRQLAMYQLQEEIDEMKRTKEEASQQCVLVENLQGQLEQAHKTIEVCVSL